MTSKYPYSQALAKSLTEKLGGLAFVLPGGDVQCDTPDGTLTVYADGAVRVRECGETEPGPPSGAPSPTGAWKCDTAHTGGA